MMLKIFLCLLSFAAIKTQAFGEKPNKDTLIMAWTDTPRSFDPRYAVDADSQYLENLMHCSLIDFDQEGRLIPSVAKALEWKDDKTLEITLSDDVFFSDGEKVEAKDIKATYDFFLLQTGLKTPSPRASAFSGLNSVEIKDHHKIIFHLKSSDPAFTYNLVVGILQEELAKKDPILAGTKIPSCGPFVLESTGVNEITLVANSKSKFKPKLSTIKIKTVSDEGTRFSKLLKGELDLVQNAISYEKIPGLSKYKALRLVKKTGLKTSYIGFNFKDPVLANKKVREAIGHAINRDAIIKYVLKGLATKANTILPPDHEFYNQNLKSLDFNQALSRKLLDEAGYKDKRLELSYKTTNSSLRVIIAEALAADLKKVGIDLKIESQEWGKFKDDVEKGRVQLWGLNWIGFKDPDIYRFAFSTSNIPPQGANRGNFSNAKMDEWLEQASVEIDPNKRKEIYNKVQMSLNEELPYIFLWHDDTFAVIQDSVKNFALYADGRYGSLTSVIKF